MERIPAEKELPLELGVEFNKVDFGSFVSSLRERIRRNPSARFSIVANWVGVNKAREAKALLDMHGTKLHIDSITIRATREQYEEDVNAFESGVQWEEIPR